MTVLLGVIVAFAGLSLIVAVVQAMAIVRVAPASEQLASFMPLGWWKFGQIGAKAGPAAAEPLNIYKRSVVAFLVFLVLGLVLSGWAANQVSPQASAATASLNTSSSVTVAQHAVISVSRRVATMPGAPILES